MLLMILTGGYAGKGEAFPSRPTIIIIIIIRSINLILSMSPIALFCVITYCIAVPAARTRPEASIDTPAPCLRD